MDEHNEGQSAAVISYDNGLRERAKRKVVPMFKSLKAEIEFSGVDTPRILFHGFGYSSRALRMFETNSLNPDGELLWFTNSPYRAALSYGTKIEGEETEGFSQAGLTHHLEEGHEEWYRANEIKEDLAYILVLFPHEDTNLGGWVTDKSAPSAYAQAREYITDQNIPLARLIILRLDKLRPYIPRLERGEIKTKAELLRLLKIDEDSQKVLRNKLKSELQRQLS